MIDYESDANERIDSRTERALTQYLTVLGDVGRAKGADGLFLVVSQSGSEYLVDTRKGRCECDDHHYRGVRCKHLRRVAFATGRRAVPTGIDGVDPQLGEHTDEMPRRAASDGGVAETADDTKESDEGDERPDDCDCGDWNQGLDLPCWPCYRENFETPASAE
jgi:hypothetical protein